MSNTTLYLLWAWVILILPPLIDTSKALKVMGKRLGLISAIILYISLTISLPLYYYKWIKEILSGNKK